MSKEKQILQMLQDGYSQRCIASTLRISRNTVAKVLKDISGIRADFCRGSVFYFEGMKKSL